MSRRALGALTLASAMLTVQAGDSARACDRTSWIYDPVDVAACVDITYVTVGNFEFANHCSDALTLSAPDCDHCSFPASIPPGESGMLMLDPEPTREADGVVDLAWETGDTSGTLTFTFPVNACSGWDSTCVATPCGEGSRWWTLLAAVVVAVVVRRQSRSAR
jgi:hypothetical protein